MSVKRLLSLVVPVVALFSCGESRTKPSGDQLDTSDDTGVSAPDADYGDCASETVDLLPVVTLRSDEQGGSISVETSWNSNTGDEVLCCATGWPERDACMAQSPAEVASAEADPCNQWLRDSTGDYSGWRVGTVECGPMWLDDSCCAHLSLSWYDTGNE